jgi:Tat protein translocase TatB subunit
MCGIGMQELILILVVALIVIGPKRLPDLARALGKAMGEFRRATDDIRESLDVEGHIRTEVEDLSKEVGEIKKDMWDFEREGQEKKADDGPDEGRKSGQMATEDGEEKEKLNG